MKKPSEISDYYERLGVDRDSSVDEIKSSYRKLAMQYHPDKNPGREKESKIEFIAVSEAYENLTGCGKKDFYDNNFEYFDKIFRDIMETTDFFKSSSNSAVREFGEILKMFL